MSSDDYDDNDDDGFDGVSNLLQKEVFFIVIKAVELGILLLNFSHQRLH